MAPEATASQKRTRSGGELFAVRVEGDAVDNAGVPAEGSYLLARPGVPDLHRLVKTCRGDLFAVGAEADPEDRVGVPVENA